MVHYQKWLLFAIVLVGFLLRFFGLSHDLHEYNDYHPDTAKQIRAIERFLDGKYYTHTGVPDYDGYPYFNPHLVEYFCRSAELARAGLHHLVGVPYEPAKPDIMALYWLTRIFNASLAVLLILVVFQIGRENFNIRAAFVAAAMLAVSPADVVSCHYATCDTTAAFFATLAVLFAFRIYKRGFWCDYILAVLFSVCAFAAKYHAGMAILPVGMAHILRIGSLRRLCSIRSLAQIAVMAVTGVVALFLAIPTLFTHFNGVVNDIVFFLHFVSRYRGIADSVRNSGVFAKFLYSMNRNLPIVLSILGPLVCVSTLLGLFGLFRRFSQTVILYTLPLVYFLVGVSLRPAAHPVYHTLITPLVFLSAAVFLTEIFWQTGKSFRRALIEIIRWGAITTACGYMLVIAVREDFFFWHQDVSRMAQAWMEENVPRSFFVQADNYTVSPNGYAPADKAQGYLLTGNPEANPRNMIHWKRFALEDNAMAVFRNISIDLYLPPASPMIDPGFRLPVFQLQPSPSGNQFVFANGPEFWRRDSILTVEPVLDGIRWVAAERPLDKAWIIVQNGAIPNFLTISFGAIRRQISLTAQESACVAITVPQSSFPSSKKFNFYRLQVAAAYGPVRVGLAVTPGEAGPMMMNAGLYCDALPLLSSTALTTQNPTLAAQALVARYAGGLPSATNEIEQRLVALSTETLAVTNSATMRQVYGISPEYLAALDYITLNYKNFSSEGFVMKDDAQAASGKILETMSVAEMQVAEIRARRLTAGPFMLDPGYYTVTLRSRNLAPQSQNVGELFVQLVDACGRIHAETPVWLYADTDYFVETKTNLAISRGGEFTLVLKTDTTASVALDTVRLTPDPLATVRAWGRLATLAVSGDRTAVSNEPLAFDLLTRMGDRAAKQSRLNEAADWYMMASALCPFDLLAVMRIGKLMEQAPPDLRNQLTPYQERSGKWSMQVTLPADVQFAGGLRLVYARLSGTRVRRGETLGIGFNWKLERPDIRLDRLSVFVHIKDKAGKIAFQGDYDLMTRLKFPQLPDGYGVFCSESRVPDTVPPGTYTVIMGLFDHETAGRYQVLAGDLPHTDDTVTLPVKIVVSE